MRGAIEEKSAAGNAIIFIIMHVKDNPVSTYFSV